MDPTASRTPAWPSGDSGIPADELAGAADECLITGTSSTLVWPATPGSSNGIDREKGWHEIGGLYANPAYTELRPIRRLNPNDVC